MENGKRYGATVHRLTELVRKDAVCEATRLMNAMAWDCHAGISSSGCKGTAGNIIPAYISSHGSSACRQGYISSHLLSLDE